MNILLLSFINLSLWCSVYIIKIYAVASIILIAAGSQASNMVINNSAKKCIVYSLVYTQVSTYYLEMSKAIIT